MQSIISRQVPQLKFLLLFATLWRKKKRWRKMVGEEVTPNLQEIAVGRCVPVYGYNSEENHMCLRNNICTHTAVALLGVPCAVNNTYFSIISKLIGYCILCALYPYCVYPMRDACLCASVFPLCYFFSASLDNNIVDVIVAVCPP